MTVNLDNGTQSLRVEVLEVAETKKELETKTDDWTKTIRALAIEKEITSRQNTDQRENGFLNVWPKEKNYTYYFSDLEDEMDNGVVPLPLVAALHIRDGETSNDHHEWIEFSPYEVFMPKYGVAIDMKDFGKKFNAGYAIDGLGEKPIHFLLGLCGSAYTILRNYTLQGTLRRVITIVQNLRPQGYDLNISWRYFSYYFPFGYFLYLFDYICVGSVPNFLHGMTRAEILHGSKVVENSNSKFKTLLREVGKSFFISCVILIGNEPFFKQPDGSWNTIWSLFGSSILTFFCKCVGNLINMLLDISGYEPFYEYLEAGSIDISSKNMMLVDAGIAFNSPYPVVLRPGREIDIIISFDFSDRGKDTNWPFEELEKAAKWAKERCIPFPNITEQLKHIEEDWKEGSYEQLYVFKGDKGEPTIIHFVMNGYNVNVADHFDILPEYSTLRFDYSENEFKKLNSLVENQVTSNVHEIKRCIRNAVDRKKKTRLEMGQRNAADKTK